MPKRSDIIVLIAGIAGLILACITLFFGDNIFQQVTGQSFFEIFRQATDQQSEKATIPQMLHWVKSPVWSGNQSGIQDQTGKYWTEPDFDDTSWSSISLPDQGEMPANSDQYYRAHFDWDGSSEITLSFVSDDGIEIYINGKWLGVWGQGWRRAGCINNPTCEYSDEIPSQSIPATMLMIGDNVIAVNLTNGPHSPSLYFFSMKVSHSK